jgi:hypothetical protein
MFESSDSNGGYILSWLEMSFFLVINGEEADGGVLTFHLNSMYQVENISTLNNIQFS